MSGARIRNLPKVVNLSKWTGVDRFRVGRKSALHFHHLMLCCAPASTSGTCEFCVLNKRLTYTVQLDLFHCLTLANTCCVIFPMQILTNKVSLDCRVCDTVTAQLGLLSRASRGVCFEKVKSKEKSYIRTYHTHTRGFCLL